MNMFDENNEQLEKAAVQVVADMVAGGSEILRRKNALIPDLPDGAVPRK